MPFCPTRVNPLRAWPALRPCRATRYAGRMPKTDRLLLAGDAGLRIGEVVALEWRCVTARGLCVCATNWRGHVGTPKSGRTRLVPLTARLRGELDGLPRELPTVVRFVPTSWVVRVLDPICARLRIARVTLHACRHSFASELARRGVALGTIRDLLGHSNVATTDRYLHTEPEQLAEAVAALDVPGGRVL